MQKNRFFRTDFFQRRQLIDWYAMRAGRILARQIQVCLQQRLSHLFGYHLVQIGLPVPELNFLSASPVRHFVILEGEAVDQSSAQNLIADALCLPLATDGVDGVLLFHALDFSIEPHQVLREAERILIPEGRILIVGYNPWSICGLKKLLHFRSREAPWIGHFFSSRRVEDWLYLLGFEIEATEYLYCRQTGDDLKISPYRNLLAWIRQGNWSMARCVYVIEAVKRSRTLTPIRPKWKLRKKVLPAAVEPTTRNSP